MSEKDVASRAADSRSATFKWEFEPAHLAVPVAEVRVQEALEALEAAAVRGAMLPALEQLEAAVASAESAYRTVSQSCHSSEEVD